VITPESAIVLVLLSGGAFRMGAELPAPGRPPGSPNCDPHAKKQEAPVHEVTLDPFFASKYEVTQAQWMRFTGSNPSQYQAPPEFGPLHPVESVSLEEAETFVSRLGLELPTEAQWEYLARGGTSTIWWTGDEPRSLAGAADIADAQLEKETPGKFQTEEWLDDGYARHAPVGTYRANAFGLHDTAGNVWEWVSDYGPYTEVPAPGNGAHGPAPRKMGLCRGGGWNTVAVPARSANRFGFAVTNKANDLGLRPVLGTRVSK
jgi:formylglycine-generating enzyme required for sulfatase activity